MSLRIVNLKKSYRSPDGQTVPVIDLPSLTLDDGEQVALIGGSGCGKTTLLHLIAGILSPDSGSIQFDMSDAASPAAAARPSGGDGAKAGAAVVEYRSAGANLAESRIVDITRLREAERDVFRGRNIGYIYQTHHLLPGFTAMENVLLGMSFTGRAHDPAWAKRLLNEVGLSDRLHYKPQKLSVGQQQRVAVARALANRPRLVLADEPTGALDPRTAQQVLELIRKLCREVNATLLLVSHDPAIARQLPRTLALTEINQAVSAARSEVAEAVA